MIATTRLKIVLYSLFGFILDVSSSGQTASKPAFQPERYFERGCNFEVFLGGFHVGSWWVPVSWCQVEFGARKPGMLNSAVLRERAFCEQHPASIFISYRRQDQTHWSAESTIYDLQNGIQRHHVYIANMSSNIIRKNVHTWNTPSSLKWFVRTICWSRSSAAGKGFFWIPSPGRRNTGAATNQENQKRQVIKPQNAQILHLLCISDLLPLPIWMVNLRPQLPRGCRDCEDGAKLSDDMASHKMTMTIWIMIMNIELTIVDSSYELWSSLLFGSGGRRGGGRRRKTAEDKKPEATLVKAAAWSKSSCSSASEVCHSREHRGTIPKAASLHFAKCCCEFGVPFDSYAVRRQHWGMMCLGTLTCSPLTQITTTTGPKRIWLVFALRSSVAWSSWCWILLISCNRWKDLACPADGWHLQTTCMFLTMFRQCLLVVKVVLEKLGGRGGLQSRLALAWSQSCEAPIVQCLMEVTEVACGPCACAQSPSLSKTSVLRYSAMAEWDGTVYTVGMVSLCARKLATELIACNLACVHCIGSLLAYALVARAHGYSFAYALDSCGESSKTCFPCVVAWLWSDSENCILSLVVVQDLFRVNGTHAATSKHLRSAGDGISCLLYPVRSLAWRGYFPQRFVFLLYHVLGVMYLSYYLSILDADNASTRCFSLF